MKLQKRRNVAGVENWSFGTVLGVLGIKQNLCLLLCRPSDKRPSSVQLKRKGTGFGRK